MQLRCLVLKLVLLLLLTGTAWAERVTALITYSNGEVVKVDDLPNESADTFLRDFLKDPREGTLELNDGSDTFKLVKKADKVTMLKGGESHTLTVKEMLDNFDRARAQGQLTACKSNQKNIGTALEMWSTDYNGKYPETLSQVTPDYLKTIPKCPAANKDTYSGTYLHSGEYFQVRCSGKHHDAAGLPANFPAYNNVEGIITDDEKQLKPARK